MNADDLRASILQAAIQGKLTKQDPNDEPASVLVERIREEKHRLVKEGKIKKDKNESIIFKRDGSWFETINGKDERCIDNEIPFEIPESWTWARQKEVFTLINGRAYSKSELLSSGKYRVIRVGNFFTNSEWYYSDLELEDEKYCSTGDLLYAWSMSFGPKIWDKERSIFHYHIWKVDYSDAFYRDFLYYWLLEDTFSIRQEKHGTSMQHVTMKMMNDRLCVIPPYSEQKRIVSAIMNFDDLIHSYGELELKHSTLISTIQSKLQISILQEAIQGNLVKHDLNDEPASILVERIRDEKHRLIMEGKIKKDKNESFIFKRDGSWFETINGKDERCIDDDIPFEIPASWTWARLGFLTNYGNNNQVRSSDIVSGSKVVELEDIEKNTGKIIKLSTISESKDSNRNAFRSGNILYSKLRPYLNKVAIPDFDGYCSSEIMVLEIPTGFSSRYLQFVLMSPFFVNYAISKSYGTKMPRLGTEDGKNALIPVSPIEEQKRIVDVIDKLLINADLLRRLHD
mgnify:CR=1 FL=1